MKKIFYRVEKGDYLLSVAKKLSVPVQTIICQNNLVKEIEVGDLLVITPPKKTYKVQVGDTLFSVAEKYSVSENCLKEKNGIDYIYYGQMIVIE